MAEQHMKPTHAPLGMSVNGERMEWAHKWLDAISFPLSPKPSSSPSFLQLLGKENRRKRKTVFPS